jgi:hypothetical protein
MNNPSQRPAAAGWGARRIAGLFWLLVVWAGGACSTASAASVAWVGPTTGNHLWSAPSNWQGGRVPGPADDVVIQGEGLSLQVQITGTFNVRSLDSAATLRVVSDIGSNSQLTVSGPFVNRGVLRIEGPRSDRNSSVTVNGAVPLDNRGLIQVIAQGGGGRRFVGGIANRGRIQVEAGIELAIDNRDRELASIDGRLEVAGTLSISGGRVRASGGQWTGLIRAFDVSVVSEATFNTPGTLRLLGSQITLIDHASPGLTLRLDTDIGNNAVLTALPGARNAGRILLGSSRSDRFTRMILTGGSFTNLPQGVLEVVRDEGGSRDIQGTLVNQGLLTSSDYGVDVSGTYQADGGQATGDIRFNSIRLLATRSAPVSNQLQLFGADTLLLTDVPTNLVLRVISEIGANATLLYNTNLINRGSIRLESRRSDRTTLLRAPGLRIENRGEIVAVSTNEGGRRIQGNIVNHGRLAVDAGMLLTVDNANATFTQAAGRLEVGGSLAVVGGAVAIEGGQITGDVRLFNASTRVSRTAASPASLRLLGPQSELVDNGSTAVTLVLDTDVGNFTTLTTRPGAVNLGRIVLSSSRSDRPARIEAAAGFTNAPGASVEVARGEGGERSLQGRFINQGTLSGGDGTLLVFGTYQADGGQVTGDVRFVNAAIAVTRSTAEPTELSLFGSGSSTLGSIQTNLVLRVISDAGDNGTLTLASNAVNQGTIVLESPRSDRVSALRGADGVVRNGPDGLIVSLAAGNGPRRITSALTNQGTVRLGAPLELTFTGGNHVNAGRIELGSRSLAVVGASFLNARTGRILGSGEIDARGTAFTHAGLIAPGSSPGRLVIRGNVTVADTGILDVEIVDGSGPGTGHDVVEVLGGRATLTGGVLATRITGAFVPAADVRFRVLSADGGVTGRFARTPNLQVLPNRYLQPEYLPTALDLRTLAGVNTTLPPSIVVHPASQEVAERASAQFVVSANGTGPFTYQWRRNGVPISGATSSSLTLPNVLAADFAEYDVVVSNAAGSSTSDTARLNQKSTDKNFTQDYGDAPDRPYPTTQANGGASQRVYPGFSLGLANDADDGTQQNATATADVPDEDGVTFLDAFVPGQAVRIQVVHLHPPNSNPGRLSAWIDWNDDGDWADAGERIITHQVLLNRTNQFLVTVPGGAAIGTTFSRFRLYPDNYKSYDGASDEDGEVEDYSVEIVRGGGGGGGGTGENPTHDFGDAPDTYRTTLLFDGARHANDPALYFGTARDLELDGQPSPFGLADDLAGSSDDEDGVTGWPILNPGSNATISISVVGSGRVDAWFDFDIDGSFIEPGDRVITGMQFNSETKTVTIPVPITAKGGGTFARFRLSRLGVTIPFGNAPNGEVEDYPILILAPEKDWGDAPDGYPTTLKDEGARHRIVPGFRLGKSEDGEDDGQPNGNSTGDDLSPQDGSDDEDGVNFTTPLIPGQTAEVRVEASAAGRLDAWIDFDGDRNWLDATDRIFTGQVLVAGLNTLTFSVPANAVPGRTFSRFRLSRDGLNTFTGDGGDGEVEDHRVVIDEDQGCDLGCTGTDFWITFPGNYAPDPANPVEPRLRISGAAGTSVTVSAPGLGFNTVTTLAGSGATVVLPATVDLGALNDSVLPRGIHITATGPVRVHAINRVNHTSDGFLALPTEVITGDYVIAAYPNSQVGVPEISGSQFALVATVPNTRVVITPSYETGLRLAGLPYSIVLTNAGDCYQLRNTNDAPADLSGSLIEADQPVAVFGGHVCASVNSPSLFFCDYLVEQLLPTSRLGSEFFTAPLATRSGGETVRIIAARNNTTLTLGAATVVLTNRGDVYQTLLTAPTRIASDKPIQLTQLASSSDFDGVRNSDPFLVNVPARAHFTTNHTFATGGTNFLTHHVSVVVPSSVVSLTFNGTAIAPGFTNIPSSNFKYAHLNVGQGIHTLSAAEPFGAIVYGWSEYESYGWPSCLFFGDTTPPRLITVTNQVTVRIGQPAIDIPCKVRVPDLRPFVTLRDNCGLPGNPVVSQDPAPGSLVGAGTHEITLSTEDNRGNVGSTVITLTVVDPNPSGPVSLDCPADITVRCEDGTGAVVEYEVEALRGCTPIAVQCDPPSGSRFPVGTTQVTCRITEPGVPVQVCTFKVTVDCSRKRTVSVKPPFRPAPTAEIPDPPAEIEVEWDAETGAVLEVTDDLATWREIPTTGNRHVIKILKERGKFFRIRGRR